ncbi:DUF2325 domain-containing protein [Clostridioides difficile]|uniref:DUF2325 domain-containing protein n=1 Tax=Clostridioides difficile TaxID=1496 RepID=UPI0029C1AC2C|nr:DUF2325 domain-containing protein [Clostridioides difficile]MDX5641083.1 DUF2325 domain-containing protein [Clostridioides difficile]
MNLLVIGGHERMEKDYMVMAKKKGYKTKVYTTMSSKLNNSIGKPDAVVILTSTVSHKMSRTVESQAKKQDILIVRHKHSSKVAFNECLDMVDECL